MINFQKIFQPKIFGLDLSGPIIRVAQTPNKFASGANIQEAIKKAKIKTKYVNAALPEAECFIKLVSKNSRIIEKEVEANIPLPLAEIYYDCEETSDGLLIAAVKRKVADKQIVLLQKSGLIINDMEPESLATARALIKTNDTFLIIKTNFQQNTFIICSKQIVRFVTVSSANILEQAREYIDFYQTHDGGVMKIILCGDADLKEALMSLQKLNWPIEIAKNPAYATANGLALKNA